MGPCLYQVENPAVFLWKVAASFPVPPNSPLLTLADTKNKNNRTAFLLYCLCISEVTSCHFVIA
jgi:hypothetical protein